MKKRFGVDILADPNKAMVPEVSAFILVDGMTKGVFTGKKLGDYFNAKATDWRNARRIVNGLDKVDQIASIAKEFYADLMAAGA